MRYDRLPLFCIDAQPIKVCQSIDVLTASSRRVERSYNLCGMRLSPAIARCFSPLVITITIFFTSFVSDAQNSPTEQPLTSPQHEVYLSWKASHSKHVVGYNIYRGNRSGGPYKKINHVLDPNTNYTDWRVTTGHTYYYVARAVNSHGRESIYSKDVKAVIP